MAKAVADHQTLLILDYGSQYTQLIARRARQLGVYSLILPYSTSLEKIRQLSPKGIILSGGPNSVYAKNAPGLDKRILEMGAPVLGICYGLQLLALSAGGKVEPSAKREYGLAKLKLSKPTKLLKATFQDSTIWMSHGDHVSKSPKGFTVTAKSGQLITAMENPKAKLYGLQFHPEVSHTAKGQQILKNFIDSICGFSKDWAAESFIESEVSRIRQVVGSDSVICALSGGVDSSVAAALVHRAIGKRQLCIFVDTGLLRAGEYEAVLDSYKKLGLNIKAVRAKSRFYAQLAGVSDPERKRKIIGAEFIKVFEEASRKTKEAKFLVQGTLYPDVIESVSVHGPSVTIKSHHNVGGLPKKMKLKLLEPLRELFKDEVRVIGSELGLPEAIVARQPFPGPGLAIRMLGPVTPQAVELLQQADLIVRQEIEASNQQKVLWQYFAILLPIKSVGVMGDGRTYERVVAIRAVTSLDGMTADWAKLPGPVLEKISNRIINEVKGINRVVYDITSKPPGTIEWE